MNNKYKRREFLENVCPQVALAMFGVTLIEACSKGDDEGYNGSSLLNQLLLLLVQ